MSNLHLVENCRGNGRMLKLRWSNLLLGLLLLNLQSGCSVYSEIARQNPSSANFTVEQLAKVGSLFESQGATAQAIRSYERAVAMDPSNHQLKERIVALRSEARERPARSREVSVAEAVRNDTHKNVEFEKPNPVIAATKNVCVVSNQKLVQQLPVRESPSPKATPQASDLSVELPSTGQSARVVEPQLWPKLSNRLLFQQQSQPLAFWRATPTVSSAFSDVPQVVPLPRH